MMDAVGIMGVTLFNDAGSVACYGASFGRIGYGISLTALHTSQVDDFLISIPNLSARVHGVHGFTGKLAEDAFQEEEIGYDLTFVNSPIGPSVPFYVSSAISHDLCLLHDAQPHNDDNPVLFPGVLLADGIVRLIACNGNPRYKDAIKIYQSNESIISIDKVEFARRKRALLPEHISYSEGKGYISGEDNQYIMHDISTLSGASGGIILNSRNQIIGLQNGDMNSVEGGPSGTRNVAVNLNTDFLKRFFLRCLVPRFPANSVQHERWSAFCLSPSS